MILKYFVWTQNSGFKGTVSVICLIKFELDMNMVVFSTELGTLEWWISGLMLNPLFLLIWRL